MKKTIITNLNMHYRQTYDYNIKQCCVIKDNPEFTFIHLKKDPSKKIVLKEGIFDLTHRVNFHVRQPDMKPEDLFKKFDRKIFQDMDFVYVVPFLDDNNYIYAIDIYQKDM